MQIIDTMKKALLLFSNLPWRQKISYNNKNFKQLFKNKSFWMIWWWIEKRKIISYRHDPDDKSLIFLFLYLTVLYVVFQLQIPFIFYTWHVYEEHNMYYQYFTHNYLWCYADFGDRFQFEIHTNSTLSIDGCFLLIWWY